MCSPDGFPCEEVAAATDGLLEGAKRAVAILISRASASRHDRVDDFRHRQILPFRLACRLQHQHDRSTLSAERCLQATDRTPHSVSRLQQPDAGKPAHVEAPHGHSRSSSPARTRLGSSSSASTRRPGREACGSRAGRDRCRHARRRLKNAARLRPMPSANAASGSPARRARRHSTDPGRSAVPARLETRGTTASSRDRRSPRSPSGCVHATWPCSTGCGRCRPTAR